MTGKGEFRQSRSRIIRIKRVAHTKAGGRVLGYQALAIHGNGDGSFGWAVCRSSTPQSCRSKAIKKAALRARPIRFDTESRSFARDTVLVFGRYSVKIKRAKKGTGVTASPLVSLILNFSGIENACVKVVNRPDVLLLVRYLSAFLHGGR